MGGDAMGWVMLAVLVALYMAFTNDKKGWPQ